ncbi:hypothetical protein B0H10DRAFT_1938840 [Mycena sp. CBHHK59/15]|nr:hypothetical protein B0H10DRAFT_1938840 [Mycena sp. CBHHK59/15]
MPLQSRGLIAEAHSFSTATEGKLKVLQRGQVYYIGLDTGDVSPAKGMSRIPTSPQADLSGDYKAQGLQLGKIHLAGFSACNQLTVHDCRGYGGTGRIQWIQEGVAVSSYPPDAKFKEDGGPRCVDGSSVYLLPPDMRLPHVPVTPSAPPPVNGTKEANGSMNVNQVGSGGTGTGTATCRSHDFMHGFAWGRAAAIAHRVTWSICGLPVVG